MKKILFLLFVAMPYFGFSQYGLDAGITIGAAGYLGDIGGKDQGGRPFILDLNMKQSRQNYGGFVRYRIKDYLSARIDLMQARLQGADSLSSNPERVSRNLSFRNDIIELSGRVEYTYAAIHDFGGTGRYLLDFRSYVFLGAGVFYNNPKSNYGGSWVALQPLQTEGRSYSKVQASIPFGVGMYWTYRRKHRIGLEVAWHYTFTDYMDDISSWYPNDTTGMSVTGAALSNRNPELASSPIDGKNYGPVREGTALPNPRGNPNNKDSYILVNLSYSYVLKGKYQNKKFNATRRSTGIGRSRRTNIKRRTRAKF